MSYQIAEDEGPYSILEHLKEGKSGDQRYSVPVANEHFDAKEPDKNYYVAISETAMQSLSRVVPSKNDTCFDNVRDCIESAEGSITALLITVVPKRKGIPRCPVVTVMMDKNCNLFRCHFCLNADGDYNSLTEGTVLSLNRVCVLEEYAVDSLAPVRIKVFAFQYRCVFAAIPTVNLVDGDHLYCITQHCLNYALTLGEALVFPQREITDSSSLDDLQQQLNDGKYRGKFSVCHISIVAPTSHFENYIVEMKGVDYRKQEDTTDAIERSNNCQCWYEHNINGCLANILPPWIVGIQSDNKPMCFSVDPTEYSRFRDWYCLHVKSLANKSELPSCLFKAIQEFVVTNRPNDIVAVPRPL